MSNPSESATHPTGFVPAPPTGRTSWMLGLLAFIPLPFVGLVLAAIAMIAANGSAKRTGQPVAIENGRRAANWGLTVLTVMGLCVVYVIVLAVFVPETRTAGFFPIGVAVVVYLILAVVHLIVVVIGIVRAGGGKVGPAFAIPYLRPKA